MKLRAKTSHIVIHRTEIIDDTEYHFIIEPDGHVHRCIPFTMRGAHALEANSYSVGVAVFGNFAALERSRHPTPSAAQIIAAADLIAQLRWWYGSRLPIIGHSELGLKGTRYPEKLVDGHDCPGKRGDLMEQLKKQLGDI